MAFPRADAGKPALLRHWRDVRHGDRAPAGPGFVDRRGVAAAADAWPRSLTAMIMLAGIYYGAQYGGTYRIRTCGDPGRSELGATVLDGYKMARQGRGGAALAIAAIGSFLAGTISIVFHDGASGAARRDRAEIRASRDVRV